MIAEEQACCNLFSEKSDISLYTLNKRLCYKELSVLKHKLLLHHQQRFVSYNDIYNNCKHETNIIRQQLRLFNLKEKFYYLNSIAKKNENIVEQDKFSSLLSVDCLNYLVLLRLPFICLGIYFLTSGCQKDNTDNFMNLFKTTYTCNCLNNNTNTSLNNYLVYAKGFLVDTSPLEVRISSESSFSETESFYLNLNIRWQVIQTLEVILIALFLSENNALNINIQGNNDDLIIIDDNNYALLLNQGSREHTKAKTSLIKELLLLSLHHPNLLDIEIPTNAGLKEKFILNLWASLITTSYGLFRRPFALMTFWDFIHSAVNDLFSENRYELYGQLWTLLVKLCDYGFSNYCQRATSNFSFKDHVEAFWEFLLAYMNLSFVIKDGPMIIERQLPSLTSIMEKSQISKEAVIKKLWEHYRTYKNKYYEDCELEFESLEEQGAVYFKNANTNVQRDERSFKEFLKILELHVQLTYPSLYCFVSDISKNEALKGFRSLVARLFLFLPSRVVISREESVLAKKMKTVQFQQHTTLFGLKYMVELVLSVSNLSPSSELENFRFEKRIEQMVDFQKSNNQTKSFVLASLLKLLKSLKNNNTLPSPQKNVLEKLFDLAGVLLEKRRDTTSQGEVDGGPLLSLAVGLDEALGFYPLQSFVPLFMPYFCKFFKKLLDFRFKLPEEVFIKFCQLLTRILKNCRFSAMQHFKRNTDSYEDFGDDLLVHDSIGPFGSAEQSGLFKHDHVDLPQLLEDYLKHPIREQFNMLFKKTFLNTSGYVESFINCFVEVFIILKNRANENSDLSLDVLSKLDHKQWIDLLYNDNARLAILLLIILLNEANTEGLLSPQKQTNLWFLCCLEPIGILELQHRLSKTLLAKDSTFYELNPQLEAFCEKIEDFENNIPAIVQSFSYNVGVKAHMLLAEGKLTKEQCRTEFSYFNGLHMASFRWSQRERSRLRHFQNIVGTVFMHCPFLLYKKNSLDYPFPQLFQQSQFSSAQVLLVGQLLCGISSLDYYGDAFIKGRMAFLLDQVFTYEKEDVLKVVALLCKNDDPYKEESLSLFRTFLVDHPIRQRLLSRCEHVILPTYVLCFSLLLSPIHLKTHNNKIMIIRTLEFQKNFEAIMAPIIGILKDFSFHNGSYWSIRIKTFKFMTALLMKLLSATSPPNDLSDFNSKTILSNTQLLNFFECLLFEAYADIYYLLQTCLETSKNNNSNSNNNNSKTLLNLPLKRDALQATLLPSISHSTYATNFFLTKKSCNNNNNNICHKLKTSEPIFIEKFKQLLTCLRKFGYLVLTHCITEEKKPSHMKILQELNKEVIKLPGDSALFLSCEDLLKSLHNL